MNFSVVRGADSEWGKTFAMALAAHQRHLILIGEDENALKAVTREVIRHYRIIVHYFVADDSDTASIISVCEKINDHFEVDMLVNYAETGLHQRFSDYDVHSLDRRLKTNHASGTLYLHQLLPNLLLHAHARVIDLRCSPYPVSGWEQALLTYNMRFAEYLNAELHDAGLHISSFSLPVPAGTETAGRAKAILGSVLPGYRESRVSAKE
nr:SDR family NAD(P)-dependent oxidoreductase [uncultured Dyadobacter sp.]